MRVSIGSSAHAFMCREDADAQGSSSSVFVGAHLYPRNGRGHNRWAPERQTNAMLTPGSTRTSSVLHAHHQRVDDGHAKVPSA